MQSVVDKLRIQVLFIMTIFEIAVSEVTKAPNGQNLHKGVVQFGQVNVGATVSAEVNQNDRRDIQKNHSATHLLHAALKSVLGDHVNHN